MEGKLYSLDDLRQVKGIGKKTIERIKEQFDESEYISEYDATIHVEPNELVQGDMLGVMNGIPDKSIDLILTDLPYGTTACSWDSVIPFDKVWKQYNRVIKDNGAVVLTARQPFTSSLIMSNIDNFRQTWVWDKVTNTNFMNANKMHIQGFEDVVVFYKELPTYNPQMEKGKPFVDNRDTGTRTPIESLGSRAKYKPQFNEGTRFPRGLIKFTSVNNNPKHPTQKPVALLEYLIKTYTNENEVVLDSTMGSGSTGVACKNTNRNFIGIELDKEYFEIAKKRIGDI